MHTLSSSLDNTSLVLLLLECCQQLEEGHRTWATYKKESAWGLKRLELPLEEKSQRSQEKMEEVEGNINVLREEQRSTLERVEVEY
ncbi:hypothetical protein SAY87_025184 [Trapa incisa]|uniref:Uncharacterized protein n=1 Tax=Trapa incisa TaxID=236973 RepID=A0AAN7GAW0_9MYRT|nr:hypothetical protein SAY87_025184 [Trapa incisa]